MRSFSIILLLCFVQNISANEGNLIIKSNKRTFDIEIKTFASHWGVGVSETNLFIAFLTSNHYQSVKNSATDSLAKKLVFGYAGDSCLHYMIKMGKNAENGKKVKLKSIYNIEVYDVITDFASINEIFPYDPNSYNSIKYTKSRKPFIDIENRFLNKVSDSLWAISENELYYAWNSYCYVARNFKFENPESGFKSLKKVIAKKSSDCGNLSSVLITLLRIKKIPARHLMGFRPDGSLHVWAEFYLEGYGWIPLDVTYKIVYPEGDYFGKIKFRQNGFIVHRGIGNIVVYSDVARRISGLQTYSYEVSYSNEYKARVYIDRQLKCTETSNI